MCGSFNTLTSTDVTLTTSQEKLTQTRHRYVNDPPLNRFFISSKGTQEPPRTPVHTKIKNVSDTDRKSRTFFRRFRGPSARVLQRLCRLFRP